METFNYTVKIHPAAEGGYWAEVPALPGCFTQGESPEEATAMIKECIEVYLGRLMRRGEAFPVERSRAKSFAFPIAVRAPRAA